MGAYEWHYPSCQHAGNRGIRSIGSWRSRHLIQRHQPTACAFFSFSRLFLRLQLHQVRLIYSTRVRSFLFAAPRSSRVSDSADPVQYHRHVLPRVAVHRVCMSPPRALYREQGGADFLFHVGIWFADQTRPGRLRVQSMSIQRSACAAMYRVLDDVLSIVRLTFECFSKKGALTS